MLDFKGWEKVGEDKKTTTLKHKSGHTLTLAHSKLPKIQQEHLKRLKFAEGTPEGTVKDTAEQENAAPPAETNININATPPPSGSLQSAIPAMIDVPKAKPTPNVLLPSGSMNAPGAAQTAQGALDLTAQIAAEKAKADVVYQSEALKERQRINDQDAQNVNELKRHTDEFGSYMRANPINPNAYLENMGTGHRIVTGLGLLLSGAGSGLSGQSNMAMDFINKQIDRNIDAQKARSEQQKTVWGAYNQLYGNQVIATNLSKVSMNDMLIHQAAITAAQLGTPQAQANLMALKATKAAENNKLLMESAGLLSNTPNAPKGAGQPEQTAPKGEPTVTEGPMSEFEVRSLMGPPGANASIKSGKQAVEDYYQSHALVPNAEQKLDELQFGTPQARKDYPKALEQYTQMQQVEKQIQQINDLFPQMREEATYGGNIAGHINPHALAAITGGAGALLAGGPTVGVGAPLGAGIGAAIGEGAGHALKGIGKIVGGQKEVQYQTDKAALSKFLIGALGNQATGAEIDNIVDTNTPSVWDDEKTYHKKLNNLRKFLLKRTDTSLLERYGLAKKK